MKKLILSIIFVFFAVSATAAELSDWEAYQTSGDKSPKWDSLVEAAFSSFDGGNLAASEIFLQRAIVKGCDDGLVYTKIGVYYEAQNNLKKAISYFQKAAKRLPNQYPSHSVTKSISEFIGRDLFILGEKEKAVPYLERSLNINSENFTPLYLLGEIYASQGNVDRALPYLEKSLAVPFPKNTAPQIYVLIMIEVAKIYYDKKEIDQSLEWWDKILKVDPNNQTAQFYKSEINRQRYKEHERKVLEEITR